MNLTQLSDSLEKIYNKLGNKYLTDNFITEPFEFKVKVRYGTDDDNHKYVADVYSIPDVPRDFDYKPELKKIKIIDGIHRSVLNFKFQEMIEYVDLSKKGQIGINFVNRGK